MGELISAKHLKKYFNVGSGTLHAVDDVNFSITKARRWAWSVNLAAESQLWDVC